MSIRNIVFKQSKFFSMDELVIKFGVPFQSFLDSSFFQELSRLKLDVLRLESNVQPLYATINLADVSKASSSVHLFLNDQSFTKQSAKEMEFECNGWLYNFNTIEEFKSLDKSKFIREKAYDLFNRGCNDINESYGFYLINFADLKKYKFYYWICMPCFQWDNSIFSFQNSDNEMPIELDNWFKSTTYICGCIDQEGNIVKASNDLLKKSNKLIVKDTSKLPSIPSLLLKNILTIWQFHNPQKDSCKIYLARIEGSFSIDVSISSSFNDKNHLRVTGWEKNMQGKLLPKIIDLGSLIDPIKIADQTTDLNLKLMKWRIVPDLNLEIIKESSVLLLGAGTLGCYVARNLLAWGVRKITFVDNGTISFSNPVRQALFNFDDLGKYKAEVAASSLKKIFPLVNATGYVLNIPMIGHPITNEIEGLNTFNKLNQLVKEHDVIFLLMDSRESRWLPTVLGNAERKIVINAALGFDSYLVMRHGNYEHKNKLGCYFCSDIVAPTNSLKDRTLDQMCTVTRPGIAMVASAQAVELLVSILQSPNKNGISPEDEVVLGEVPHQIRGFLNKFSTIKLKTPAYPNCSACSKIIIDSLKSSGWGFVREALNNSHFVEDLCGLVQIQSDADKILETLSWEESDNEQTVT